MLTIFLGGWFFLGLNLFRVEDLKVWPKTSGDIYTLKGHVLVSIETEMVGNYGFKSSIKFIYEPEHTAQSLAFILKILEKSEFILEKSKEGE